MPPQILTAFYRLMAADPANLPKPDEIKVCQVLRPVPRLLRERHHEPDTFARLHGTSCRSFSELYGRCSRRI